MRATLNRGDIAVVDNRMKRFGDTYHNFFQYHVVPVLHLDTKQIQRIKNTSVFKQSTKAILSEQNILSEMQESCQLTMAHSLPLFSWIYESNNLLRNEIKKKDHTTPSMKTYKERIGELVTLMDTNIHYLDDHALVVWSWWLPQAMELFSLTRLIFTANSQPDAVEGDDVMKNLLSTFDIFEKNTIMAVYLLSGAYLPIRSKQFESELNVSEMSSTISLRDLIEQFNTLSDENTNKTRKLVHKAQKLTAEANTPTRAPLLTLYQQKKQDLLLAPKYEILMALTHLILVQHEEEQTAKNILDYCRAKNCLVGLLKSSINQQIANAPSSEVLFREESAATKLMSSLLFSEECKEYLYDVTFPVFRRIRKSSIGQEEIDLENMVHCKEVQDVCNEFLNRVYQNVDQLPAIVRILLSHAQKEVGCKFPAMRQVVVGSFLFLRFLIPVLVTPERYQLSKKEIILQPAGKKAVILISRILQAIANGSTVHGKLAVLAPFISSNQAILFSHFDVLGQVPASHSVPKMKIVEVKQVHACFLSVIGALEDYSHEMIQIISAHFDEATRCRYMEFLSLSRFSVFQNIVKNEKEQSGMYFRIAKHLCDGFSKRVSYRLLGVRAEAKDKKADHWYSRFHHIQLVGLNVAKQLFSDQKESYFLLCLFVELHTLLNSILEKWNLPKDVAVRKDVYVRKAYMISYLLYQIEKAPVLFFVPESWIIWETFLRSISLLASVIVADVASGFISTQHVHNVLVQSIVNARWIISRLTLLHSKSYFGL